MNRLLAVILLLVAVVLVSGTIGRAQDTDSLLFKFGVIAYTPLTPTGQWLGLKPCLKQMAGQKPDFILVLGDWSGQTLESLIRLKEMASQSKVQVYALPGDDEKKFKPNKTWLKEFQASPAYSFDHKGIHFIWICGATLPMDWLKQELDRVAASKPVIYCQPVPPAKDDYALDLSKPMETDEPWTTLIKYANVRVMITGRVNVHRHLKVYGTPCFNQVNTVLGKQAKGEYGLYSVYQSGKVEADFFDLGNPQPDLTPTPAGR